VGLREFEEERDQMVSPRSMMNEKMSEAEQMALMLSLRMEMDEMKKNNDEQIITLRRENEEMKRKLIGKGPSDGPSNLMGRPKTTSVGTKVIEEPKPTIRWMNLRGTHSLIM